VSALCVADRCNNALEQTARRSSLEDRINSRLVEPAQSYPSDENSFSIRSPTNLGLPSGEAVIVRYMDYRA
jgi:hypothetical protein